MLLKQTVLKGIVEGRIRLAFRRWKRPTVSAGGSLRTAIGVLAIASVEKISKRKITKQDAELAGYASRAELLDELDSRPEGAIYRIALEYAGEDPRKKLRKQDTLSDELVDELKLRLTRLDSRSRSGPWTSTTLEVIAERPAVCAAELAEIVSMETKAFKANVRKLKELGLTESLKVGYRLSPRGVALRKRLT